MEGIAASLLLRITLDNATQCSSSRRFIIKRAKGKKGERGNSACRFPAVDVVCSTLVRSSSAQQSKQTSRRARADLLTPPAYFLLVEGADCEVSRSALAGELRSRPRRQCRGFRKHTSPVCSPGPAGNGRDQLALRRPEAAAWCSGGGWRAPTSRDKHIEPL